VSPNRRPTVERGSEDSDWQAVKDAAKKLAFAEDRAIFNGYAEANIEGVREENSNPIVPLPADVRDYPDVAYEPVNCRNVSSAEKYLSEFQKQDRNPALKSRAKRREKRDMCLSKTLARTERRAAAARNPDQPARASTVS